MLAESCAAGKQLAEWRVGRSAQSVEEIISAILQARRDNSRGVLFIRSSLAAIRGSSLQLSWPAI